MRGIEDINFRHRRGLDKDLVLSLADGRPERTPVRSAGVGGYSSADGTAGAGKGTTA